jgi:nicotinamidase-related amidase
MPVDLATLVHPSHTAVLTMELQRGVIGDLASIPELAAEVASAGVISATSRLVRAARRNDVRVVHCTAEFRADRAGTASNSPLLAVMMRRPGHLIAGSPETEVVPELGPEPTDVFSRRAHGVSPFTATSLDVTLRNLGVTTVVATGVSVNIAILGLTIEAVNLGYQVVLPTDCVAGVPAAYASDVIRHTLALLATRTTADDLVALWDGAGV